MLSIRTFTAAINTRTTHEREPGERFGHEKSTLSNQWIKVLRKEFFVQIYIGLEIILITGLHWNFIEGDN